MRSVMPPITTGRDLNEHEWECDWVFWCSSSLLSSPNLFICKSWGVVVVVGSCGGTDSGTQASTSSSPIFPLPLNVLSECAWKASGQHFAGSGPYSLFWELRAIFRAQITTSEFFGNWQSRRWLFTPDLRLFQSNTEQDKRISANSQIQHWTTAIFWLTVTSAHALFLHRIEESSQPSIIL